MSVPIKLKGEKDLWEMVIGLEVHAQVKCKSKLFSGAANDFGADPNSLVSFVDAAMPGMLPVLNKKAVDQAIKTGHALNAKINEVGSLSKREQSMSDNV